MLRRLLSVSLVAFAALSPSSVGAANRPGVAGVLAVQKTRVADLVMLGGGFDAGLRQGMVCRITRGGSEIAEIVLVDLRPACSSALIVSLAPGQAIRVGDLASVKILKT